MTSVSRGTMRDPDSSCHQPVSSENAFLKNLTGLALSDLGLNQRCFATSRYQTLRSYWSLTPCARLLVTAHWEGVSPGPRSSLSWKRAVTAGHPLPPILSLPLRGSTGSTQTVQDSRSRAFLLRVPTGSRGLGAQDGTTVSSGARRGQFRPGTRVTERLLPHDFPSCKAPTEASNAPQSGPPSGGTVREHHDRDAWPLSGVGQILSMCEFQNN